MPSLRASAILSNWRSSVIVGVQSPRDKVAQALVGDYRPEHLFTLKQSLEGYRYYQKLILELDQETARLMQALPSATEDPMPPRTKATAYHRQGNDPQFDLRRELYRIAGVDLTDIPGVSAATAQVILTEIGTDVSRFRNASAFASWLGLCPEKTSQRRQSAVLQNPQGKASRRDCAPDGRQLPLPRQGLLRRVLSAHASQAGHGPGDHRHCT